MASPDAGRFFGNLPDAIMDAYKAFDSQLRYSTNRRRMMMGLPALEGPNRKIHLRH